MVAQGVSPGRRAAEETESPVGAKEMAHTYTNLLTHMIFSTKERHPFLDEDLRPRLLPYMSGIVNELGGKPLLINGPNDHVHMLVVMPPTMSVADFLRILKTNSSRWVHQTWASLSKFSWQAGYGAFSVSESVKEDVRAYIAGQEEPHRSVTFKEEFVAFLKRHGIEYDERYIWD
jgi:putative transposase